MNKKTVKYKYDRHFGIEPNDDELDFYYDLIKTAVEEEREEGDKRWIKATSSLIKKTVEEEQERVRNRIEAKEKFHRKKFKEFQEKTNGNVMNGHLIKAETCKEILSLIKE